MKKATERHSGEIATVSLKVPHSIFDTRGHPGRQAFAAWRDNFIYDVRLRGKDSDRFFVHAGAFHFGDFMLVKVQSSLQHLDRSRARIGRDSLDNYTMHF